MAGINTDIDVCNIALGAHLGKHAITAYDDGSSEGKLCLRYYDFSRQLVLGRSPWTFARGYEALAEVTNDLSDEWDYAYDLPSAALKVHRVTDPAVGIQRNAAPTPRYIANGKIYCNVETAWCEYIADHDVPSEWSPLFVDAVAMQLAYRISSTFVRRRSDRQAILQEYEVTLGMAIEEDATQEPQTYAYNQEGYVKARGSGDVNRYDGRGTDGSSFWS